MPSVLIYFIPASWIILIPLVFFISNIIFFISLKMFNVEENIKIFKKYFLKVFLSSFFSNVICSILIFLIGFFTYIIYQESIYKKKILIAICIFLSIILNTIILKNIMFLNLKIDKNIKKYISIIISCFSASYILLFI
ncbi:hypothetical protein HMPREF3188_00001 [Tissierellia bacterium KA00581]|nr:hypothetical protein HMPREF3188_00001 [Tissierellia bacterium KA00581]